MSNPEDKIRFLVTFERQDLLQIDQVCMKQRISRNRYIVITVMKAIEDEIASEKQSEGVIASEKQSISK